MKTVVVCFFYETERASIKNYERSVDTYFERFEKWARIQNEMIIFIQGKYEKRVLEIRRKFGLEKKTKIIILSQTLEEMFPYEYQMCKQNIEDESLEANVIKLMPTFTSVNYCMVTCAKFRLLKWASEIVEKRCQFLYIDFGLADLADFTILPEYFEKEVSVDYLPDNLITIYTYDNHLVSMPVYSLIRYAMGHFYTCMMAVPSDKCSWLDERFYDCFRTILRVGLSAQDQNVMYMLWKENPECFNVVVQSFPAERYIDLLSLKREQIKPIYPHGGMQERLRKTPLRDLLHWYRDTKENLSYLKREKKYITELAKKR